ncbi:MAG TPA: hypothetical protein VN893_19465 [Bryobacteraceae bacterium]|nr:hypothetical protein [Bryobacteraceae bacterium]
MKIRTAVSRFIRRLSLADLRTSLAIIITLLRRAIWSLICFAFSEAVSELTITASVKRSELFSMLLLSVLALPVMELTFSAGCLLIIPEVLTDTGFYNQAALSDGRPGETAHPTQP